MHFCVTLSVVCILWQVRRMDSAEITNETVLRKLKSLINKKYKENIKHIDEKIEMLKDYIDDNVKEHLLHLEDVLSKPLPKPVTKEGPCAKERAEKLSRTLLPGEEIPDCDDEGFYAGMQRSGSKSVCVTREGKRIDGYSVNRWEVEDNMKCNCARRRYRLDNMDPPLVGGLWFSCQPNGNYEAEACLGSVCFCVDEVEGKKLDNSPEVNIWEKKDLVC